VAHDEKLTELAGIKSKQSFLAKWLQASEAPQASRRV